MAKSIVASRARSSRARDTTQVATGRRGEYSGCSAFWCISIDKNDYREGKNWVALPFNCGNLNSLVPLRTRSPHRKKTTG
jgi:hypothetical protein